jgi:peptide/nickel transport system permease protein
MSVMTSALSEESLPAVRGKRASVVTLLWRKKASRIGLVLYSSVVLCAIFAPLIAPFDPLAIDPVSILQRPSTNHLLGTDELGRDILSRIIFGARVSISVSVIAVAIALVCGIVFGVLSGYFGGWVDTVIMRCMDALAAFPAVLLALAILSALGPGIQNAMIAIGVVYIPAFARVMRGSVLAIKQQEFVEAARANGATTFYLSRKVILPNCMSPLLVHGSIGFANAIVVEAALSFLGLGSQPPSPSWGAMLNEGRRFIDQNVWYSISAGAAIFVTVMALNLLGDGLRDVLDPRLRNR